MPAQSPTSRLPPIRQIDQCPTQELSSAVAYLRHVYNPPVRGSRIRYIQGQSRTSHRYAKYIDGLDELRSDIFERKYAIRWLTALVAQIEVWAVQEGSSSEWENVVQEAASLLAICSGTAAAGIITRDFLFDRDSGDKPLKVCIRDVPLDNRDYGSVGSQTWGGSCVLAEIILNDPVGSDFSLDSCGLRILEFGAGTGLVSLVTGKLLEETASLFEKASVVATDFYPSVLENLRANIQTNFPSALESSAVRISSCFLDWSSFADEPHYEAPLNEPFDMVVGADIVYEAQHAFWIRSCLNHLLRKPADNHDPLFHLVIPLRSTHAAESSTIETVFANYAGASTSSPDPSLVIVSKQSIFCEADSGAEPDQVEYAYYKIGWR